MAHTNWMEFFDPLGSQPLQLNLLIGGGFEFAQDQTPGTLTNKGTNTVDAYGPDGWKIGIQNGLVTAQAQYQRVDTNGALETNLRAEFYGTFKMTAASSKMMVYQPIESVMCFPYASRTVSFQLKLKTSSARTLKIGILALGSGGTKDVIPVILNTTWSNTTGTDPVLAANVTRLGSYVSCAVTTAWQLFTVNVTLPSNAKNILPVILTDAQMANGDTFSVAEAQLFDGLTIQPWLPRPIQQELALLQRYYFKTFAIDTAPAQNVGIGTGEFVWPVVTGTGGAGRSPALRFPVTMRVTPTGTTYNPAAANAQIRDKTAVADCASTAIQEITPSQCWFSDTNNAATAAGNLLGVHFSANARL